MCCPNNLLACCRCCCCLSRAIVWFVRKIIGFGKNIYINNKKQDTHQPIVIVMSYTRWYFNFIIECSQWWWLLPWSIEMFRIQKRGFLCLITTMRQYIWCIIQCGKFGYLVLQTNNESNNQSDLMCYAYQWD